MVENAADERDALRRAGDDTGRDATARAGPARDDLGAVMSEVARSLQQRHGDVEATLRAITRAAVTSVPGAADCGITYVRSRRAVEPRAWTSELTRELDELQFQLQQGPCLDAVWEQRIVRVPDLAVDTRWPEFAAEASRRGIGSMLTFQLFVGADSLGALNLYAPTAGAFGGESENVGLAFAGHAAVALAGAQQEEQLRAAIGSRDLIGQAKGILMERHRLTAAQAFTVLIETSSRTNRKIVDIAEELTSTGALAPAPRPPPAGS
jgi:GAF domain-containing protein